MLTQTQHIVRRYMQTVLLITMCSLRWPGVAGADAVTDWSDIAQTAIVTNAGRPAPAAIVDAAYVFATVYDAVNAIDGRFSVFAVSPSNASPQASQEAAVVAAAHHVLKTFFPSQQAFLDTAYAASLAGIPLGSTRDQGVAIGVEVATAFLALRANDGRNAVVAYTFGSGPGVYQLTPGAPEPPASPLTPWIAQMKPFTLISPSQFRADGPPHLTSAQWAEDFNEVKVMGALNDSERTTNQTEIGRFYQENPAAQLIRNFRNFAAAQPLSLADRARLLAALHITTADAVIACFDSKYFFNFWRPVTAIRAADTDDNEATEPDPGWLSLVPTPNHPEYPAAHGVVSTAYAEALRHFFGTKKVTITLTSTITGTAHTFHSTDDIIKEIIVARIYGGMHYRTSGVHGSVIGKKVAHWVAKHYFQPSGQ
jgi:PAP2 superfamily